MGVSMSSAVLAFVLQVITARFYGTRFEMDAFLNASTIPIVLFGVFNGAVVAALVPTFSDYMSGGKNEEVCTLGSTVINLLLLVMTGLAIIGWFLAPLYVPIFARGFPPAEQRLVTEMVRWLLPSIVATSVSGVCTAQLNSHHRFIASALVTVVLNIVTIGAVLVLHQRLGIFALVLGSVIGTFCQLLVQLRSIIRNRLYRFVIDLRHPGLARAWSLIVPVAIGSGASQINLAFDRYFASTLKVGSTAAIGYTAKLSQLPIQIVAGAIATVIFPLLAQHFAGGNRAEMRRSISLGIRMLGFVVVPCAVGLAALAYPVISTLFERGAFGPAATAVCVALVPFACIQMVANSYVTVLGRACYACKEARLAVCISIGAVTLNVVLSAIWLSTLGARGLMLANGIAGLLAVIFQLLLLQRLIGRFEWKPIVSSMARIVLASVAMAVIVQIILHRIGRVPGSIGIRAAVLVGLLAIASLTYLGTSRLLGTTELGLLFAMVARKFGRTASPELVSETVPGS
jgi:putative peptidoglycan lipid II flippase